MTDIPKPTHSGARHCVDAFVFCVWKARRWLLLIERADGLGWAVPGGGVKPAEFPDAAVVRELEEETGLRLDLDAPWEVLDARRVPDPRETADAWYVTVPHVHDLGVVDELPALTPGSDAVDARWVRACTFTDRVLHVADGLGGGLFPAHEAMIREVIDTTP